MYLGLNILLLISGHVFFMIKNSSFLNQRAAKSLFHQFQKAKLDLLASRLNTKCTKFASCKTDPYASHVFSLCWSDLNSYIFVGRVLARLE